MGEHLKRGITAATTRNPVEAVHWFRKAVAENPADSKALAWLGQALCATGERLEGTVRLHQAGDAMLDQLQPGGLPKVVEIIVQLQHWGELAGALGLCRRAARTDPQNARVQQLLAVCLGQMNQPAEALTACTAALALGPDDPMLQVLHASLEADNRQFQKAADQLTAVLTKTLLPMQAFRAHKELARAHDALGAYDGAFSSLAMAGALADKVAEFQRLDRAMLPAMIAAYKTTFSAGLLGKWSGTSFAGGRRAPVFLIGFYRSGTTLTQAVLDAHPDVFVADEANLVYDLHGELLRMDPAPGTLADKLARLDQSGIERLRDHYWTKARGRYGDAVDTPVFIDKFTLNTVEAGLINVIFPDAKIIFMMRDPRDVCLSCFMQLMVPTPATIHLHGWQSTADFYATVMTWWLHIRDMLTVPYIEIRYEDAVDLFEPTYTRILSFLGLAWEPAMLAFHTRAKKKFIASPSRNQVAQPLYTSSLARWRHYDRYYAPIEKTLAPFIAAFDYPA